MPHPGSEKRYFTAPMRAPTPERSTVQAAFVWYLGLFRELKLACSGPQLWNQAAWGPKVRESALEGELEAGPKKQVLY